MSISSTLNLLKRKQAESDSQPGTPLTKRPKSSGGLSDVPDSLAPASRTPSKIDSSPMIPVNQATPEKPQVANASDLKSPPWYHDPDLFSPHIQKNNKELRRLKANLDRSGVKKTLILEESPKKDPERIRNGEVAQNERGCFEVPSTTRDGSRIWTAHEKSLHPIKGKGECDQDLVTLSGPDLKTLIEEERPPEKKFKAHLRERVSFSKEQRLPNLD